MIVNEYNIGMSIDCFTAHQRGQTTFVVGLPLSYAVINELNGVASQSYSRKIRE